MLVRCIALVSALLIACKDATSPVTGRTGDLSSSNATPAGVDLLYDCGNRYTVRSEYDVALTLRWVVHNTSDAGVVSVPARGGQTYAVASFTTIETGLVKLFDGSRQVGNTPNRATTCPASPIPPVAPESIPLTTWNALVADTNLVADGAGLRMVRNALYLGFTADATDADRTNAIAAVGGSLVGGMAWGLTGRYIIQIPYQLNGAGDSASGPTRRAQVIAEQQPGVFIANTLNMDRNAVVTYRLPNDGTGFARADWSADKRVSAGRRYHLEVDNAPLMWGCATGDELKFTLVDEGFGDDMPSELVFDPATEFADAAGHGNFVAGIGAARSDNGIGSTGMLWGATVRGFRADLVESPGFTPEYQTLFALLRAKRSGARVINVSLGVDVSIPYNETLVRNSAKEFSQALDPFEGPSTPLIVLSAGNRGDDVSRGPYTSIRKYYPELGAQVLIVGGSQKSGAATFEYLNVGTIRSGRGKDVDVVAPAREIFSYDGPSRTGVSAAVPQVTGVALLLLQQNPQLRSSEIRELIIAAASEGQFFVSDPDHANGRVPSLDGYRALRQGSRIAGAPLCGTDVWFDDEALRVRRSGTPEVVDVVGVGSPPTAAWNLKEINPQHGGLRLNAGFDRNYLLDTTTHVWVRAPDATPPNSDVGGTYLSMRSIDHDVSHAVVAEGVSIPGGIRVTATRFLYGTTRQVGSAVRDFPSAGDSSVVCIRENKDPDTGVWYCAQSGYIGRHSFIDALGNSFFRSPAALSPSARDVFALVPVTQVLRERTYDPTPVNCFLMPNMNTARCYSITRKDSTVFGEIWRVKFDGSAWQRVLHRDVSAGIGSWPMWVGISEDALEMVVGWSSGVRVQPPFAATQTACRDRRIEWLAIDALAVPGTTPGTVLRGSPMVQATSLCNRDFAAGGLSPIRASVRAQSNP